MKQSEKMSFDPRDRGGPIKNFWDDPSTITRLESVKNWLMKFVTYRGAANPPPTATAQSLSKLIQEFIQFQNDHLGRSARNPTLTRLPVRLFYDLSSGGSLCHILFAMYKFKNDMERYGVMELRRFDLSSPYMKNTNLQMCKEVEDHLIRKKFFYIPVINIKDNVSAEDTEKIMEIIKKKRGVEITSDTDKATHIIHPKVDHKVAFCRPVFKRGDKCLVHFFYMPDSRDQWRTMYPEINRGAWPEDKADIYNVSIDWVLDMEQYNEWMNEEDYELDDDGKLKENGYNMTYDEMVESCQKTGNKKKAGKRKRSPSPDSRRPNKGGSMNAESVNEKTQKAVEEIQGKLERKKKEHLDIEKGISGLERKQEELERAMMLLEREKKKIEVEKKSLSYRRKKATDEIKSLEESLNAYVEVTKDLVSKLSLGPLTDNKNLITFLTKSIEEKEALLECPVCLQTASSPIFSCGQQMHLVCSSCHPRLTTCPECREGVGGAEENA